MRQMCEHLYSSMLSDIQMYLSKGLCEHDEILHCFKTSEKHLMYVDKLIRQKEFNNVAEEIEYFKIWKPRFVSSVEYYCLLNHALLFKPSDIVDQCLFWQREAGRMQAFLDESKALLEYYKSGSSEKDSAFFIQARPVQFNCPFRINIGNTITSSHDHWFSTFMVLEKYIAYANERSESVMHAIA